MTLRKIHLPGLGRDYVFGCLPARRPAKIEFGDYVRPGLVALPAVVDYSPKAAGMEYVFCNDRLGCCVVSMGYHGTGIETGNAGNGFVATDDQIVADYSAITGYSPADPSTDQGTDPNAALAYWTKHGFADGTKLAGYMSVDAANKSELMQAIYLTEAVMVCISLPDAWLPLMQVDGFVVDVAPENQDNGHCMTIYGYNAQGVFVDTWGIKGCITWAAMAALASVNVWLDPDELAKATAKSPQGFDWATLQSDFSALNKPSGLCGWFKRLLP